MLFSPFERMVAMRYLRARRQEGFISVIGWFSLIGIALGVGTLIVVMSVMNGFRQELFQRVMGLNGHMNVYAMQGPIVIKPCWITFVMCRKLSMFRRRWRRRRW